MKQRATILKNKIVDIKADYSHVNSRLFFPFSKSKEKSSDNRQQLTIKTVRQSVEKIEQIAQQKYKQAMKHMSKFNKYEEQRKRKQQQDKQKIDKQCSFKPKVNNNKMQLNQTSKFIKASNYLKTNKKSINDPEKKDSQTNTKIQKQVNYKAKNPNMNNSSNNLNSYKTAERLIQWGKRRDNKLVDRTIQIQVSKILSRQSSYSSQRKSVIRKQSSYHKMHGHKLNLTLQKVINQSNDQYNYTSTKNTPRANQSRMMPLSGRSASSLLYHNSSTVTPKANTMNIEFKKSNQATTGKAIPNLNMSKTQRYHMDGLKKDYGTYGQRLLVRQSDRGEGSFYLRQARANVMKNYQKADLLMKDKHYSRTFSMINTQTNRDNLH